MIGIEGVDSTTSGEIIHLIANPYKIHYNKYEKFINFRWKMVQFQGSQTNSFAND